MVYCIGADRLSKLRRRDVDDDVDGGRHTIGRAAGSGQGGWGRAHALDREPQKIKSEGENWQPLTVWRKKSAGVKAENYRLGVASLARERCSEVEKLEPGRVAF